MSEEETNPPSFTFKPHPSTHPFSVPSTTYLLTNPTLPYTHIATSALVFSSPSPTQPPGSRILLLQRAATDTLPHLWEPPGGACDPTDLSILHSAARELWEETGLVATEVGPVVGGVVGFVSASGKRIGRVGFLVGIGAGRERGEMKVKLNPREHQKFVWATREEVERGRCGDVVLEFTKDEVRNLVLEAFDVGGRESESG
ncbi:hypothetical protein K402DRAFT_362512 [Aulographum hederae CBS 113979]|uniref:Nudix hydrolase domain-containing protein n=1 Tax=Aulographum hederae CBS 113979 TaxID=1176131 RepID=A0A6G1GPG4_9PEZI|nr:hypothetical protein K402DRAFT_362512 [Aulographum hederae CBS 113979]